MKTLTLLFIGSVLLCLLLPALAGPPKRDIPDKDFGNLYNILTIFSCKD